MLAKLSLVFWGLVYWLLFIFLLSPWLWSLEQTFKTLLLMATP